MGVCILVDYLNAPFQKKSKTLTSMHKLSSEISVGRFSWNNFLKKLAVTEQESFKLSFCIKRDPCTCGKEVFLPCS